MRVKKLGILVVVTAFILFLVISVSCAPRTVETTEDPSLESIEADLMSEPLVTERPDGTLVQRTPSEIDILSTITDDWPYHYPENMPAYNIYYLDADNRGCNACHNDLAETLKAMQSYLHVDLTNSYGIQVGVQQCIDCHTFGFYYITNQYSFGSLIHGIHGTNRDRADCWNCHIATGSGAGMQLWDLVKHSQLRGITAIHDVEGEFSFSQDKTTAAADIFDFGWQYFELDYLRYENTVNNVPLDQEMFDNWTITISGEVEHELTFTLPELIERFGSETQAVTFHCTLNPTGGPLIANAVYTGVPLSLLFEEAGISPDAGAFSILAPDGFEEPVMMDNFSEAWICYQIDGEPLPWRQGYPVQLIVPHSGAPQSVKQVSDIVVNTAEEAAELHEWNGWPKEAGIVGPGGTIAYYTTEGWPFVDDQGYRNKPNVGIFDFEEGRIIETGVPYTFTGYAAAYDEQIVAIEFSMDGGVSWTRYDTSSSNKNNWVIWSFTITPEFDSAYVLSVRSVSEVGRITETPIQVMFNAKTL